MAARRLIIVLVVLFVASIVAAALAPERRDSSEGETSTATTAATTTTSEETTSEPADDAESGAGAGRTPVRLLASEQDPPTARAEVGDQVELVVRSEEFLQIEIPAFGVTGNAAPAEPARFSLILRDAGQIPILAARSGRTVAALEVKAARAEAGDGKSDDGEESRPEPAAASPGR